MASRGHGKSEELTSGIRKAVLSFAGHHHLSPREGETLLLAAGGLVNKEIASVLGVSHKTIGEYWSRIFHKTRCEDRARVLAKFISESLSGPELASPDSSR